MVEYLLTDVICQYFQHNVGRWQMKSEDPQGLLIQFKTSVDYDTEDGHRYLDLYLYAGANYVGVYARRRWMVAPLDSEDYTNGESPWMCIGYHDSCWRDSVKRLIFDNRGSLSTFDSLGKFPFQKVSPNELGIDFEKVERATDV